MPILANRYITKYVDEIKNVNTKLFSCVNGNLFTKREFFQQLSLKALTITHSTPSGINE